MIVAPIFKNMTSFYLESQVESIKNGQVSKNTLALKPGA